MPQHAADVALAANHAAAIERCDSLLTALGGLDAALSTLRQSQRDLRGAVNHLDQAWKDYGRCLSDIDVGGLHAQALELAGIAERWMNPAKS